MQCLITEQDTHSISSMYCYDVTDQRRIRSSNQGFSIRKIVLENFAQFTGKNLC